MTSIDEWNNQGIAPMWKQEVREDWHRDLEDRIRVKIKNRNLDSLSAQLLYDQDYWLQFKNMPDGCYSPPKELDDKRLAAWIKKRFAIID